MPKFIAFCFLFFIALSFPAQAQKFDKDGLNKAIDLALANKDDELDRYMAGRDALTFEQFEQVYHEKLRAASSERIELLRVSKEERYKVALFERRWATHFRKLENRYCEGDWLKTTTTCFAYRLGGAGYPKWLAMSIVYGLNAVFVLFVIGGLGIALTAAMRRVANRQAVQPSDGI